jgi:hypothetical protein
VAGADRNAFGFVWGIVLTINDFIYRFSGITVAMDWELLFSKKPQISQSLISKQNDLGKLITVCRVKNGEYATGRNNEAEILRVNSNLFPEKFENELKQNQNTSAIPNNFYFPVYEIPDGHLILDGNHRAVALYRSGIIPNLCMVSIKGPICSKILPDLKKWE